jgi:RNA polymerase sigma factor (sigma-70 family)
MPDDDVSSLLQRYAECGCDASFATLVSRYRHLVHGAALQRLNGNAAMADDVVQRVFIQLAARAHSIDASQGLGGWLYHCAIHSAADLQRSESRRRARELIAAASSPTEYLPPPDPCPGLSAAVASLPAPDRTAVQLRFLENRPLRDIGHALGISEDAAQKRLSRALAKLRNRLRPRSIIPSASVLATTLPSTSHATIIPLSRSILFSLMKAKPIAASAALLALTGLSIPLIRSLYPPAPCPSLSSTSPTPKGRSITTRPQNTTTAASPSQSSSPAPTIPLLKGLSAEDRLATLKSARENAEKATAAKFDEKMDRLRRKLNLTPDQEAALADHHRAQRDRMVDYLTNAAVGEANPSHFQFESSYRPDIPDSVLSLLSPEQQQLAAAHESLKRTNFLEAVTNGEVNALGLKLELAPDTKDAVFNALSAINREDRFADHSSLQNLSDLETFADHDIARRRDAFVSILAPDQLQSWESEAAAWRQATLERFGYRSSETAAATSQPDGSS